MLTTALYSPTELHGLTEAALLLLLYSDLTRSLHSRWPQVRASSVEADCAQHGGVSKLVLLFLNGTLPVYPRGRHTA